MMNDGFVIHRLVATLLTAMWHLGCVSVRVRGTDNLLCMVTTLGVVTVRRHGVVGVRGGEIVDDGGG